MRVPTQKPILARTHPDKFVGREAELERLYLRAISSAGRSPMHAFAPVDAGLSELLRQLYDRLFTEQRFVVPFYFALSTDDENSNSAAARFVYQFLLQAIAFRRQEPSLMSASPDICELAKLSPIQDAGWVDRMCEVCRNEGPLNDERAFIRTALNAPFRASAAGDFDVLVIADDLHESELLRNGHTFRNELLAIAARARMPLLLASRERVLPSPTGVESIEIEKLGRRSSAELVRTLAEDADVPINNETVDLVATQFTGRPLLYKLFIDAARSASRRLESYKEVEQLYTSELLNGRIGSHYDVMFSRAIPERSARQKLYDELYLTIGNTNAPFPISTLKERLAMGDEDFARAIEIMLIDGIVHSDNSKFRLTEDRILKDFISTKQRTSAEKRTRASVAAFTVTSALKRVPKMMTRIYRSESSLGLADLMLLFEVQNVPRSFLDYRAFRDKLKGLTDEEVRNRLSDDNDTLALPLIAHAAPIADHLPDFAIPTEPERAVLAFGFKDQRYSDEDETAWFSVEIDSKLEADADLTQEWCDRLDEAAQQLGISKYRVWLVSPEGFSDTALDILEERQDLGSSRRQVQLLREFLSDEIGTDVDKGSIYEVAIPSGNETELVAVHALEEIARRHAFPSKATNQIKTALIEACINAFEHGLAPDTPIRQRFEVRDDRIVVTVSNRGLRIIDKKPETEPAGDRSRRGWGLGLIRSLMDDVRLESVDDGTRIVMTKYLVAADKS